MNRMSLRFAVLATLLDGEFTGYDLARQFDASVSNFWHALPQQIYGELKKMEEEGLVEARTVIQESRPNKRIFSLTTLGREELGRWITAPGRPSSNKDELLVRLYAAGTAQLLLLADLVDARKKRRLAKLERYQQTRARVLAGRSEEEYLCQAPRIGPYLALQRGIRFEEDTIAWCEWAADALRIRAAKDAREGALPAAGA